MPPELPENPYQPPAADAAAAMMDHGITPGLKDPRTRGWAAISFIELTGLLTLGRFLQPGSEKWRVFLDAGIALTWLGGAIAYLMWIHRCATNARKIDPKTGAKPGWAVGCHFIPFLNWLMPALVLKEIADSTFKYRPMKGIGALVAVWWISFVATNLLGVFKGEALSLLALSSTWVAGITIAILIIRISLRQADFKWSDLPALNRPVMLPMGTPRLSVPGQIPQARPSAGPASRPQPPRRPNGGGESEDLP